MQSSIHDFFLGGGAWQQNKATTIAHDCIFEQHFSEGSTTYCFAINGQRVEADNVVSRPSLVGRLNVRK